MARHYPDLGSASDWLKQSSHAAPPIRNLTLSFDKWDPFHVTSLEHCNMRRRYVQPVLGLDGLLAEYEVGQINRGIQRLFSVKVCKISVRRSKYNFA